MKSASPDEFRYLLGRFASGVTVLTATDGDGEAWGMTASALAAVSLEPPLLMVCVNHDDPFHGVMAAASMFSINVLASDQEAVSRCFAGKAAERFRDVQYQRGPYGLPLLDGVVAHILCEQWDSLPAGDHTIFLGRVTSGTVFERSPLLHYRGKYTATL